MSRGILVALAFAIGAGAAHAQVTTHTALPIHEGEFLFRELGFYHRASDDPGTRNRELSVGGLTTVAVYGASERLALFGVFPLLDKQLLLDGPGGRVRRVASGPGDSTFFARYSVYQWDRLGETVRFAPIAGVKAPTGRDDQRDGLGLLPQPLQLGSGSWDPLLGAILTWQTFDWQFDATTLYRVNRAARDFAFGDQARLDLSLKRRLLPRELGEGVPNYFYGVLESNLVWSDRNRISGRDDPDSGGTSWSLSPGLQLVSMRWVVEAAVQLPVAQNLHGTALEADSTLYLGFRLNF